MTHTIEAEVIDTNTGEVLSSQTGLVPSSNHPIAYGMPAMDLDRAKSRYLALKDFIGTCLQEGRDYGAPFPGGDKPTLLKPGAEKLTTFFGLTTEFDLVEKIEDWTGANHGGHPLFSYTYRTTLSRSGMKICDAVGTCNSWESKYRYRKGERSCPKCGKETIIKGKAEYGGGFICFAKKGGCGAKFLDTDPSILNQPVGKVLNEEPYDLVNTIMKMASKRAYMAAVLIGCNASDYFTQDAEDFVPEDSPRGGTTTQAGPPTGAGEQSKPGTGMDRQAPRGQSAEGVDLSARFAGACDRFRREFGMTSEDIAHRFGPEFTWDADTLKAMIQFYTQEAAARGASASDNKGGGVPQPSPRPAGAPEEIADEVEKIVGYFAAHGLTLDHLEKLRGRKVGKWTDTDCNVLKRNYEELNVGVPGSQIWNRWNQVFPPEPEPVPEELEEWEIQYPGLRLDTKIMVARAAAFGATWTDIEAAANKPLDELSEDEVKQIAAQLSSTERRVA